jgi:hypothetical protein
VVAAHPPQVGSAVLPHLEIRRFFYPGLDDWGSHMLWDQAFVAGSHLPSSLALERAARRFPTERVVFLVNEPVANAESLRFRLLYRSVPGAFVPDETYYVYLRPAEVAPVGS